MGAAVAAGLSGFSAARLGYPGHFALAALLCLGAVVLVASRFVPATEEAPDPVFD